MNSRKAAGPAPGLYEAVEDESLKAAIACLDSDGALAAQFTDLDAGDSHSRLAQHLYHAVKAALRRIPEQNRVLRQVKIVNALLALAADNTRDSTLTDATVTPELRMLLDISEAIPGSTTPNRVRPETPAALSSLLTGSRSDPSLASQLSKELATADQVDILCSFIKWSGIRQLRSALEQFTSRAGTRLRVLTTTYTGATELRAVDYLCNLANTEVKVSYDTRSTRLHAKAYLIYRQSGFGTAYIGSSNISSPALLDGLEWNVKVSQYESPQLWDKISGTFDTYWEAPDAKPFKTSDSNDLREALVRERYTGTSHAGYQFNIQPFPYQQEILNRLQAERQLRNRHWNIVVAATGTGKTVVAAFDYQRFAQSAATTRPRMLFIAHRKEILQQSVACFRGVLRDQNFGDLMTGGDVPEQNDHLFCSIQSYNSRGLWNLDPARYDYVVVDEFHHAAAPIYKRLLKYVLPKEMLALTATPERADEVDVLHRFGGRISAELRLPEAVTRGLLAPFHYFVITDHSSVDYTRVAWRRGKYDAAELQKMIGANLDRATLVVDALGRYLLDPLAARGLGFCVSQAHAKFMAAQFNARGIPSKALDAGTPREERRVVPQLLRSGAIKFLFVVDLYNEGVDIPEVDTVLFLRPTESLTVFLQQLGRGLRLSPGKDCLTVLDFVAPASRQFRFEPRLRALLPGGVGRMDHEVEQEFPHVPTGCAIILERVARKIILENIRCSFRSGRAEVMRRMREFTRETGKPLTFANFMNEVEITPERLFKYGTWSRMVVDAGMSEESCPTSAEDIALASGLRRASHMCAFGQLSELRDLLAMPTGRLLRRLTANPTSATLLTMLLISLKVHCESPSPERELTRLRQIPSFIRDLEQLIDYLLDHVDYNPPPSGVPFPLELYACYTSYEVLAACAHWSLLRRPAFQEGVLYLKDAKTDLLFVTLNKTEQEYSPSTMYDDRAVGATGFHWQSQSTTSESSPTGQRYIHHLARGSRILLFVRRNKSANGLACPYRYYGPVTYKSHVGTNPMSIEFALQFPIPAHVQPEVIVLGAA